MARPKKVAEVTDTTEATTVVEESQAKKDLIALIETYKTQNPAKYEAKKAELEARLAVLK